MSRTITGLGPLGLVVLAVAVVLSGCAGSEPRVETDRATDVDSIIHVYSPAALPEAAYEVVSEITTLGCKEDVYSASPSRADVVSRMKREARRRGGNALVGVTCRRTNTDECSAALQCTGNAVRALSVETLPRVARRPQTEALDGDSKRTGTGWVLAPELVVTSYRLVRARSDLSLSTQDTTLSARLVASDPVHDLALLRPAQSSLLPEPLPLAPDSGRTGERVFVAGYPSYEGGEAGLRTATGVLNAQSGALGDARVYQTTVAPLFEQGGAPLLDFRGRVLGVLVPPSTNGALNPSGFPSSPFSYAVKKRYLRQLRARVQPSADSLGADRNQFVREKSVLPPLLNEVKPSILRVTARN